MRYHEFWLDIWVSLRLGRCQSCHCNDTKRQTSLFSTMRVPCNWLQPVIYTYRKLMYSIYFERACHPISHTTSADILDPWTKMRSGSLTSFPSWSVTSHRVSYYNWNKYKSGRTYMEYCILAWNYSAIPSPLSGYLTWIKVPLLCCKYT